MNQEKTFCAHIALIGRPNVGKSTLLNALLGQKISITAAKPQTTRHRILGILTEDASQMIFFDTPGMHLHKKTGMNRVLNKVASRGIRDADLIVCLLDPSYMTEEDEFVLSRLEKSDRPLFIVLNKMDKYKNRDELLPFIENLARRLSPKAIMPISAKTGEGLDALKTALREAMPESVHYYPNDLVTDRSYPFLCAEILREKLIRLTGDELPYQSTVLIDSFKREEKIIRIHATIYVERESHRKIILGKSGEKIKRIATEGRLGMEALLSQKVFLEVFVKIKANWSNDPAALGQLGYLEGE